MKYSLFFAAAVAAYDPYGAQPASSAPAKVSSVPVGGYGSQPSSIPSKPSSVPVYGGSPVTSVRSSVPASQATPCSTVVGSNGYTTVVPGYGKPPVTVTQQHQSYPTCVAKGYDGKSCDKWEDDKYVSTVITDYNKKVVTITKVQDYVTVYHEKKTITRSATPTIGGYGAVSTPTSGSKNATGVWYELYEKVVVCKYEDLGKNVLVGYTGSGLCQKCDNEQPVVQKVYTGGKWTEEKKTFNYGKPKDEVKVYEKPGVYTVPAKVVTVYQSQATGYAGSNKPSNEVVVYKIPSKVITITQYNQPYTCTYELPKQTPAKTPSKGEDKPVTKTPTYNDYGYKASPTPTPKKPSNDYPVYPVPPKANSTIVYKPTSTPCDDDKKSTPTPVTISKPVYGDNGYGAVPTPTPNKPATPVYGDNYSVPSKPSSTPCDDDKTKPTPTPAYNNGNNNNNGYVAPPPPAKPTPTPAYNNGNTNNNSYENNNGGYVAPPPVQPTPTPVYNNNNGANYGEASKPTPTPAKPVGGYGKRSGMVERRLAAVEAQKA